MEKAINCIIPSLRHSGKHRTIYRDRGKIGSPQGLIRGKDE
jgi:hypothetical protein